MLRIRKMCMKYYILIQICETRQSEFARSEEIRSAERNSSACNVTEVMTLTLHHPVVSESRHRPELEGINTASTSQALRPDGAHRPATLSLQIFQQQQPPLPPRSPPLTLFEQKAIKTCRRPWSGPPAKQFSQDAWYPIWLLFRRMGRRKNKVVRCMEF